MFVDSRKMAFYVASYHGKGLGKKVFNSWKSIKVPGRSFGISQEAGAMSSPIRYEANFFFQEQEKKILIADGSYVQAPSICIGRSFMASDGQYFDKSGYTWTKSEGHEVWFGRKKEDLRQFQGSKKAVIQ